MDPIQAGLIPNVAALYGLAQEGRRRFSADPADLLALASCFILTNHIRDWAEGEGLDVADYWRACPFAHALADVANGVKHFGYDPADMARHGKRARARHVIEARPVGGFGMGAFGVGPFSAPYIGLVAKRHPDDPEAYHAAEAIVAAAVTWWGERLEGCDVAATLAT